MGNIKIDFKKKISILYLIALILVPLLLLLLPADFFDTGQTLCLSVLLLGQNCYGCGMTRGIQHIIHLDLDTGYRLNKLSIIVCPLLFIVWVQEVIRVFKIISK